MPRPARILMVSSEVETFARTGGLGDVVLGLSRALGARGVEVVIVTPLYGNTRVPGGARWWGERIPARVGWGHDDAWSLGVLEVDVAPNVRVCLLEHGGLFGGRGGIYGDDSGTFGDNELRFAVMSRGALSVADRIWGPPGSDRGGVDLIHAHDWHAALAVLYPRLIMGHAWAQVPTVFTVHNLAYQGVLGRDSLDRLGLPNDAFYSGVLEQAGLLNLLKGAMAVCDRASTVSPTYAREVTWPANGFGLSGFIRMLGDRFTGILNGIDWTTFDPRHDPALPRPFDVDDFHDGRRAAKHAVLEELGLHPDPEAPLFAVVSRLTGQKGIDLVLDVIPALVGRGAQVALVGTGESELERGMRLAAHHFGGRVAARIAFDEGLARRIYAGSDFLMVPSRFEPCGLTQMYAMRYGSIPIVTDVGGLHDTVTHYDAVRCGGNGFVASQVDAGSLLLACEEALTAYEERGGPGVGMDGLRERAMRRDSSWYRSAGQYLDHVYLPLIDRGR